MGERGIDMNRKFCDRCEREIKEGSTIGSILMDIYEYYPESKSYPDGGQTFELCEDCQEEFMKFLNILPKESHEESDEKSNFDSCIEARAKTIYDDYIDPRPNIGDAGWIG